MSRGQRRMEASFDGDQGPERAVAPQMDGRVENFIRQPVLLVQNLSQMNPHHIVRSNVYLLTRIFICLLPSFMLFAISSSSLMACDSHILQSIFGHPDNIWCRLQFVDLLTERFIHSSCFSYFVFFVVKRLCFKMSAGVVMTLLIKASRVLLPDL